ncbi:MAG: GEVED domain-containing protein [candidate division Zixibacteria bacterium]
MKTKLLLSLVVLICFTWSLALADTAPGTIDNTDVGSDDSQITTEMEKDRIERERLAGKETADEISAIIQAKKEALLLEQADDIDEEKALEMLELEKKAAEEEAHKHAFKEFDAEKFALKQRDAEKLAEEEAARAAKGNEPSITLDPLVYCDICYSNCDPDPDDWITNVTFVGINNTTTYEGCPCSYGSYVYDADLFPFKATVNLGGTYNLSVSFESGIYTEHVRAWIDWNQDEVFAPAESYYLGSGVSTTLSLDITVPLDAILGDTRMRVIEDYGSDPGDDASCISTSYGEAEDYTVEVLEYVPVYGACCDDETGLCDDGVEAIDCVEPARFAANTLCADLDPLCGFVPECWDYSETAPVVNATGSTCGMLNDCDLRASEEVIYQVTIPEAGDWVFSLCNSSFDTYLFVGTECCTDDVGYNDDACGLQSEVAAFVAAGTYYVTIDAFSTSTCGDYTLNVYQYVPPVGRCCYDEPVDCLDTTEDECLNTYFGNWTEGINCNDSPCPSAEGNTCGNAIVVDLDVVGLPYNDVGQTTCDRIDDYFDTCLDGYDGGEDIIYEIIVGTAGDYEITMDPLGTVFTGISIDDTCPAGGTGECIDFETGYSGSTPKVMIVYLDPGTYYIMVDTWPSPDCIPVFNLTIDTYVTPTGRCCYNYFADCEVLTEADCLAQSGAPLWDEGLNCIDDPCPTPPPGDFCNDPIVIEESFPYSTGGNTCEFNNFCDISGTDNSEVIYELEITSAVDLTVSLCGSDYDTKLAIFLNECCTGAETEFAYNDDSCGLQSEISTNFAPGLYYIVVDGFGTGCGNYLLNIDVYVPPVGRCCFDDSPCEDDVTEAYCTNALGDWDEDITCTEFPCPYPPPENDNCDTAIPLSGILPIVAYGNTELAANDYGSFGVEPACWQGTWFSSSAAASDVVYTWVVPSDGLYRISLCGSLYDTALLLYNNVCPPIYPDDFICGNDDVPDCGLDSELVMQLTGDQDLMIVVDGYSSGSGNYILTIEEIVGACCVEEVCVGTLSEVDCLAQEGAWFEGETCPEFNCELECLTQIPNQVNGIYSDLDCGQCDFGIQLIAENFIMASETDVLSLVFWGGYHPNNLVMEFDDFTIVFREDLAGVPGEQITAIPNVPADDRFDTGIDLFGVDEYQYTIDISGYGVHLLPGTYFVEILNNTAENADSWFWETGNLDLMVGVLGQAWTSTLPEEPWNYDAVTDMALDIVCEGGGGGACGDYVTGDYNGSTSFNVADIIAAFSKLKVGSPDASLLCDCEGDGNFWAVAMDLNNSCAFNVADVIAGFSKLKTGAPILVPCELCPPDGGSPRRGGDQPLIVPNLESKAKLSTGSGMD